MLRHNRRGIGILGIILALVILGVLLFIFVPAISNNFKAFKLISQKYSGPKLELKNTYEFTAKDITIPASDSCVLSAKRTGTMTEYDCKGGKPVTFLVDITNNGLKDRRYIPEIVICKLGDKDCCNNEKKKYISAKDYCLVAIGATGECNIDPYIFTEDNGFTIVSSKDKFEVHPIAECVQDQTFGCYYAGMTESVKSCNPEQYVVVNIIA